MSIEQGTRLGHYDVLGAIGSPRNMAFLLSLCAGFFTVYILEKLDQLDPVLEAFETPRQKLWLLLAILLYLGSFLNRIGRKTLFDLFWSDRSVVSQEDRTVLLAGLMGIDVGDGMPRSVIEELGATLGTSDAGEPDSTSPQIEVAGDGVFTEPRRRQGVGQVTAWR